MKAFLQLFFAMAVAMVLAAPVQRFQTAMGEKYQHAISDSSYSQRLMPNIPYVVKAPASSAPAPALGLAPPSPALTVPSAKTPASAPKISWVPQFSWLPKCTKWWPAGENAMLTKIDIPTINKAVESVHMRAPSCFCSGGSICCNTMRGIDCNYGVCAV